MLSAWGRRDAMADPWSKQEGETSKSYQAFTIYLNLPATTRSIDAAWQTAANRLQTSVRAPGHWQDWSVKYSWLARAAAHDAHLAKLEQDEYDATWLERRRISRDRDYTQADALRRIVDDSLPHAERFIRTQRTLIPATGRAGTESYQPAREVITMAFDVVGLSRVLAEASRLQRLANGELTENIGYSGAALDSIIRHEMARLTDTSEAGDADPFAPDATGDEAGEETF